MSVPLANVSYQTPPQPMPVSFRLLLSLYAIIPLCVAVQLLDQFALNYRVRDFLPSSPTHFLLFQLLFGTPHILASNLLLLQNREYLQAFQNRLLGMTAFIILFFGIGSLFIPYTALYVITACWTVYHVLKQQHGIAKAVCRLPSWAFYLQLALSVSAGILIYLGIFLHNALNDSQSLGILQLSAGLSVLLLLSTSYCHSRVHSRCGLSFLWANSLLVVCSFYLYLQEYYFLAILMPRLVHDITAYYFYISHDVNRLAAGRPAPLSQLALNCHIPVAWVLPLLSVGLTVLLQMYGDDWVNFISQRLFDTQIHKAVTLGLIGYCSLMHYYSEAFIWSAGSPVRRYIHFSQA